ncbi:MAG TPA: hypothetical protein VFD36_25790 [Kofleriaceae bacterium]|nr:hypothetical protein [Kofleriaceae bacterium]
MKIDGRVRAIDVEPLRDGRVHVQVVVALDGVVSPAQAQVLFDAAELGETLAIELHRIWKSEGET